MEKLLTIFMYVLWAVSLLGLLVITFTSFKYMDLNVIVGILFFFTILNTFIAVNKK